MTWLFTIQFVRATAKALNIGVSSINNFIVSNKKNLLKENIYLKFLRIINFKLLLKIHVYYYLPEGKNCFYIYQTLLTKYPIQIIL